MELYQDQTDPTRIKETTVQDDPIQVHSLSFTGDSKEYFKIWIINTFLTIFTFGIYSAWAKVRFRRYILGNTHLAGASFDYHADPIAILKGRLIMVALFLAYVFGAKVTPVLPIIASLGFAGLLPFLVVRSLSYNLSQTSYRNIRFGFDRDYQKAYMTYFQNALISLVTIGLATPVALANFAKYRVNNTRFGTASFKLKDRRLVGTYYKAAAFYLSGLACYMGALAVMQGLVATAMAKTFLLAVGTVVMYLSLGAMTVYLKARIPRLIAKQSDLAGIKFDCNFSARELFMIYATNALAVVFTLGLATPWAILRLSRYRVEKTQVFASNSALDQFVGEVPTTAVSPAVADAASEFLDMELAF